MMNRFDGVREEIGRLEDKIMECGREYKELQGYVGDKKATKMPGLERQRVKSRLEELSEVMHACTEKLLSLKQEEHKLLE